MTDTNKTEQEMRSRLSDLTVKLGAWISVKDKLPEEDGTLCVVFDPDNETISVWGARWNKEYGNFESMGGWFEADEVTHWMPLPKAPN